MGVEAGGGGGDPTGMLENEMREKPFMDCSQLVEQAGLEHVTPFLDLFRQVPTRVGLL